MLAAVDQAVTVLLAEIPGDESQVFAAVISGIAFGTSVFLNYGDNWMIALTVENSQRNLVDSQIVI